MPRFLHKSWQNKNYGWTRRVRWYEGPTIRLNFEDEDGSFNAVYSTKEEAQRNYDMFRTTAISAATVVMKKQAGYEISDRGKPIAAGVVCKCPETFCPAHGSRTKEREK